MEIRKLRKEEVSEVKRLCESAHWPYTLKDIERLYQLEPDGWFCATVNGQYAGQAMGLRIESLGCIGIVIVHHDFRRQGIATAVTKAALEYLGKKGIKTIKLDATAEGYGIYEKINFIPEFSILHYVREPASTGTSLEKADGIKPLKASEIDAISEFDKHYFGVNRFTVLKALIKDSDSILLKEGKKIRGYAMVKPLDYQDGIWLGPWVAESIPSAEKLLEHVLQNYHNKEIRLGALESNPYAQDLLAKYGFKVDFKITRMRFGSKLKKEDPSGIYAEAGHEKG
jgi:ribosomal protein S18 acetylase RimI-like enzyme